MVIGYDLLGLSHQLWKLGWVIKELPDNTSVGVFDSGLFGDIRKKAKMLLGSKNLHSLRVHLVWHDNHSIATKHEIKKGIRFWEGVAKSHPGVKIYVSHTCEHNEGDLGVVRDRMSMIRNGAPSCIPVNCVWKGRVLGGEVNEKHDLNPLTGRFIVSTDGINAMDIDVQGYIRRNKDAEVVYLWGERFNLRENVENVPSPKNRTAVPDRQYLRSIISLSKPEEEVPQSIFDKVIPITGDRVYKSHSEDDEGDDLRENKPCLIVEGGPSTVALLTYNGKKVGELIYGGRYGKLRRYYTKDGLYGYEIAKKAASLSGNPHIWVKSGKDIYGPIHPTFRSGYFRKK